MPYDNTNQGALFKNDKGDNDKRPDYKGPLNVNGKDYEVAAWLSESKAGKKFLKLKIEEPRQQQASGQASDRSAPGGYGAGMDDDPIPFAPLRDLP